MYLQNYGKVKQGTESHGRKSGRLSRWGYTSAAAELVHAATRQAGFLIDQGIDNTTTQFQL